MRGQKAIAKRLISKASGDDIVPQDYSFCVIERMPDWVKEVIRNASPTRSEDYSDLRKELQDLLNKYKVKVTGRRIDNVNGDKSSTAEKGEDIAGGGNGRGGGGGGRGSSAGMRRRLHETPEGSTTTSLYEVFEKPPKITMLETSEEVTEKGLKGRAAEFIIETGDLFVNGLYEAVERAIDDLEPEFVGHSDPETVRKLVLNAARRSMAFRVGKAVVFALAKRANEDWGEVAMQAALTKESSNMRRHIKEGLKLAKVAA